MSGVDLVQWLNAQLDEDERIARATRITSITARVYFNDTKALSWDGDHESLSTDGMFAPLADHIAEHDPARVLMEIDAKRWQVEMLANSIKPDPTTGIPRGVAWSMLTRMAEVYRDRPGWQPYWPGSG